MSSKCVDTLCTHLSRFDNRDEQINTKEYFQKINTLPLEKKKIADLFREETNKNDFKKKKNN